MNPVTATLASAALLLLAQADDTSAQFPSLQTTVRDPAADGGAPLTTCADLGGQRLCAEGLADAWCRQHGFSRFINWSTVGPAGQACKDDDAACAVVVTITCARVPIVGG